MTRTISTLGQCIRHRFLMQVTCRRCRRRKFFETFGLASIYGMGRDPLSLKFKCSNCDTRCHLALIEPSFVDPETIVLRLDSGGWIERRMGGK